MKMYFKYLIFVHFDIYGSEVIKRTFSKKILRLHKSILKTYF